MTLKILKKLSPRSLASFISQISLIENIGQYFESFNSDMKAIVGCYKNKVECGNLINN